MPIQRLRIGDSAPAFDLPSVDGRRYKLEDFRGKKVLVVMFTCNHCPYVQAYEDRLVAIQRDYADKGVAFVAINSNDERKYPEDGFEKMVVRAKEKGYNFPYLRDEDQSVAMAYGPQVTPEIFIFDEGRRLRYHGRVDDNWREPDKAMRQDLRDALEAILEGRKVKEAETRAIGCSVKWA